ncbi:MAG TPA: N-acetylmuramoyl-L-alanine amidase [Armatimonadota bacterium]|nr:N-acetylmuramoyl-L-alanine amidase [Armatimonadota bacterium]
MEKGKEFRKTVHRHLLRYTLLVFCLVFQAIPLHAAIIPQIVIGNKTVSCSPAPLMQNGEVFVPFSFRYEGLPITTDTDGEAVILRGPGNQETRVPATVRGGHLYYPLARACADMHLSAHWVEAQHKLFLTPTIYSVHPVMSNRQMQLQIAAFYPVTYQVQQEANPARLVIDINNAQLFRESTTIPVLQAGFTQIRASQVSYFPALVRVVIESTEAPHFQVLTPKVSAQINVLAEIGNGNGSAAMAAKGNTAGLAVDDVRVERVDDDGSRVIVHTNGNPHGKLITLSRPRRLVLDIPGATQLAQPPQVAPETPHIREVRLGQFSDDTARVVIELADNADYTLIEGTEPGSLIIRLQGAYTGTSTSSLKGLKIMLDPGHGGSLHGARALSGRREQDINLDVAQRVYRLLMDAGAAPNMTRWDDSTVGLRARPSTANTQKAQLFVSIHCNSNGQANSARGIETFYCWPRALPLARAIHACLVNELDAPDRRVRCRPGLVVTRETRMPSILVEIGYINHQEEDRLLGTPEYRQRVAQSIFDGIARYVREQMGKDSAANTTDENALGADITPSEGSDN